MSGDESIESIESTESDGSVRSRLEDNVFDSKDLIDWTDSIDAPDS